MEGEDGKAPTEEQMDLNASIARFCLELFVFNKMHWKICHYKKDQIIKLRMNLIYNILKNQLKVVPQNLAGK
jgi:hypothetical protein